MVTCKGFLTIYKGLIFNTIDIKDTLSENDSKDIAHKIVLNLKKEKISHCKLYAQQINS